VESRICGVIDYAKVGARGTRGLIIKVPSAWARDHGVKVNSELPITVDGEKLIVHPPTAEKKECSE
jgi:hypothetical protein